MKIELDKHSGLANITPESYDDLWYIYKLIDDSTFAKSITTRKYKPPGSNKEDRIIVNIEIKVEKKELHKHSRKLRLTGPITFVKPSEIASLGSYHTLDVSIGREIKIKKEKWRRYDIELLEESKKKSNQILITLIAIDDEKATIAQLKPYGIEFLNEISNRGNKDIKTKDINMHPYFREIYDMIKNYEGLIIIGGPGFTKENIVEFIKKIDSHFYKRTRLISASNSERSGIYEMLHDENLYKILENERIHNALEEFNKFMKCIGINSKKCTYGPESIKKAAEYGAISKLIIIDDMAPSNEELIKLISNTGGEIIFVPSESELAKQIKAFGGIIALLRYELEGV